MSSMIDVTASQPGRTPRLVHQGLVYGSDEAFLAATVPFCLDGLQQDEAPLDQGSPQPLVDRSLRTDRGLSTQPWGYFPVRLYSPN
ncbi:MEDS domain-containing protein [Streptomyces sp. NPDC002812]|uniref:MEDS domain-containing protein n=1 Tax=unclassified Streptomyces TaxID=2593676 RepID=UPI00202E5BB7|nr:MEDS domain-containing protein [Streptomyces sp. G1]MCM1976467.1 MEDS domain-containing protein [Streptomyces sp. G1]